MDAQALYDEYNRRRGRGEEVDLDDLCREHPDLAIALQAIHSLNVSPGVSPDACGEVSNEAAAGDSFRGAGRFQDVVAGVAAVETTGSVGGSEQPSRKLPLRPGDRVGAYRIIDVIGSGGFAVVFKAEQEEPVRRTVALKSIKLGLDTEDVIARFELERQALALMSHPSIARVFDAGTTADGRPYFVMEHVPGPSLTDYADARNMTIRERVELFLGVCEAVLHAHQKGILHRDLKPSNVLVTEVNGKPLVKVIDFGIAKALDQRLTERTLYTAVGQVIGTPLYMSPEQVDGGAAVVDTRADIYALGVILYELLVGARPLEAELFRGHDLAGIRHVIREAEPPKPSTRVLRLGDVAERVARSRQLSLPRLSTALRGDLDWITLKAMAKEPERRYASVSELVADIDRHLREQPVLAGPPGVRYKLQKLARRRRRELVVSAVAFVLLVILGFVIVEVSARRLRQGRVDESIELLGTARRLTGEAARASTEYQSRKAAHEEVLARLPTWFPIWERGEELRASEAMVAAAQRVEALYTEAILHHMRAVEAAPEATDARSEAERALSRLSDAIQRSDLDFLGPALLSKVIAAGSGMAPRTAELQEVAVTSRPPGAEVRCYRYEEVEKALRPLPYRPGLESTRSAGSSPGLIAGPQLVIDRIWDSAASGFEAGDELLSVEGVSVATVTDWVREVQKAQAGKPLKIEARRAGAPLSISWTPSSDKPPERILDEVEAFGFTFQGYPLATPDDGLAGVTGATGPLKLRLPRGSYLLVFRSDGHVEARVPIEVADGLAAQVDVLLPERAPPGFVYVPAGEFSPGGDPRAYQALPAEPCFVDGFFMSRFEVSFSEYLEFLNHPQTRARMEERRRLLAADPGAPGAAFQAPSSEATASAGAAAQGPGAMALEESDGEVTLLAAVPAALREGLDLVQLLPWDRKSGKLLVKKGDDGAWKSNDAAWERWPIFGISYLAAEEYAAWRTRTDSEGWTYRLPTDVEWEKAARGADGRVYVWGDYRVWSFCWSLDGNRTKLPAPLGRRPFDESVYGVRDLEGSVEELIASPLGDKQNLIVRRGGNWDSLYEQSYRLATRNGQGAAARSRQSGIRLVASLRPATP